MSFLVSIATPVYDMQGEGVKFLDHGLKKTLGQKRNFDLEIIISDQSQDSNIHNYLNSLSVPFIKYFRDPNRGNHSSNTNKALRNCRGDFIKILYQDDYFLDESSLQRTIDSLQSSERAWLVSACESSTDGINLIRPFYPSWNDRMIQGINTISGPSVVCLKKQAKKVMFDEKLLYMPDVDYYLQMKKQYGEPLYLKEITVVNRLHENQTQHLLSDRHRIDLEYLKQKYASKQSSWAGVRRLCDLFRAASQSKQPKQ